MQKTNLNEPSSCGRGDTLKQGEIVSNYKIKRPLNSGGFGITYLAEHRELTSEHVLKEYMPEIAIRDYDGTVTPHPPANEENFSWGLNKFHQEAKILNELNHPNVVKVTDVFSANGTAYYAMPFLDGLNFSRWIQVNYPSEASILKRILFRLLDALQYIHTKGVYHMDIKPDNIIILGNEDPILIDFGSARSQWGGKTKTS
ncbi:MAG: protein kinase, partial [Deltaproteobacteria bacterium]|nr:protein kinase [Deltaproteobacteria bacterium]